MRFSAQFRESPQYPSYVDFCLRGILIGHIISMGFPMPQFSRGPAPFSLSPSQITIQFVCSGNLAEPDFRLEAILENTTDEKLDFRASYILSYSNYLGHPGKGGNNVDGEALIPATPLPSQLQAGEACQLTLHNGPQLPQFQRQLHEMPKGLSSDLGKFGKLADLGPPGCYYLELCVRSAETKVDVDKAKRRFFNRPKPIKRRFNFNEGFRITQNIALEKLVTPN